MAKKNEITIRSSAAEYLTYAASVGDQPLSVELRYEDENIWLTQRLMAELYGVTVSDINQHLKTIYDDQELLRDATVKKFLIVQQEGGRIVNRQTDHYCLQAIIAVGFKVNNERAVQFRKWANGIVKEYTIKGWVMDDVRLKEGSFLTDKYFDAQLERIREIRMSERKFLSENNRHLRHVTGLRPACSCHRSLLCHRPEQTPLCHSWSHCGGTNHGAR